VGGIPHGLQNLLAIAAVICEKPFSISGWQRCMIDDVVAFVVRRGLNSRTSRSDGLYDV
jgi:hypothetical protein